MRRGWRERHAETRWGMERKGEGSLKDGKDGFVFSTHELRGGSTGSCVAEECRGGGGGLLLLTWSLLCIHKQNPLPWFTISEG